MPPASPDPRTDVASAIRAALEPFERELDTARRQRGDNAGFLAARRSRGLDAETRDLFADAARSPDAPDSLRRLGREVAAGRLTWDDVFRGRAGELGTTFLGEAYAAARLAVDDLADADDDLVEVPAEARAVGVDPDQVRADVEELRAEAGDAHDQLWREGL